MRKEKLTLALSILVAFIITLAGCIPIFKPENIETVIADRYNTNVDTTVNNKPTVSFVSTTNILTNGEPYTFTAIASDIDGDPLGFAWLVNGFEITNETNNYYVFVSSPSVDTSYTLTVSVFDGKEYSNLSASFTVWKPNKYPTVSLSPSNNYTNAWGGTNTFTATGSDADGDSLTYTWYVNGSKQEYLPSTNKFSLIATPSEETEYLIRVEASDGRGWGYDEITVTSRASNYAPVITLSPSTNITIGANKTNIFSVLATDTNGDSLTYRWYINDVWVTNALMPVSTNINGTNTNVIISVSAISNTITNFYFVTNITGIEYYTLKVGVSDGKTTAYKSVFITVDNSDKWQLVTTNSFTTRSLKYVHLNVYTNVPYIGYIEKDAGANLYANLKYYVSNTDSWGTLGTNNFAQVESLNLDYTFGYLNHPYFVVADKTNSSKASVYYHNATNWIAAASVGFSDGTMMEPQIFVISNEPYVAYIDTSSNTNITVMRLVGGTNWQMVIKKRFAPGAVSSIRLVATANGMPYVAFRNHSLYGKLSVMRPKSDWSDWEYVGSTETISSSEASEIAMAVYENTPYIAFRDKYYNDKITMIKLNIGGTGWDTVGEPGFSEGTASMLDIDFGGAAENVPYVAFKDEGRDNKITVMYLDTSGLSTWKLVGTRGFTSSAITGLSISVYYTRPYVAYTTSESASSIYLMSFFK